MATENPILHIPVRREDVGKDGLPLRVLADTEQCAKLAERYNLLAVDRLDADVLVRPWRQQGLTVTGRLNASITQICVVSLDPVTTKIEEAVEARFDPDPATAPLGVDDDPPEPMNHLVADLGGIIEEFFVLGIDPYPRGKDTAFDGIDNGSGDLSTNPFAVLKQRDDDAS